MLSLERLPDSVMELVKTCNEWLPQSMSSRAVLVGAVVGFIMYQVTKKRYNMPPGPPGWPLLGNILDFRNTTIYQQLLRWKSKYGPIITFRAGPETIVALNDIDVVMEALVKNQSDFAGRPQSYSTRLLSDGGRSIALGDYSPTWKLHRKLATKALRHYMTGLKLEESIERSLSKGVELIGQQKKPFNPHNFMSLIVFNIISNICFNRTGDLQDNYFKTMVNLLDIFLLEFGNGVVEDFIPPLRLFPSRKLRNLIKMADNFFKTISTQIEEHRTSLDRNNLRDFCDMMLVAQEEADKEEDPEVLSQITDRHITQTLADIFAAGMDTSRFTLLWSLLYLAIHQDVQKKLHDEIDAAFGGRKFPKLSDRPNLPYTDAVLHEVMRIAPVASVGIPHKTIKDTKIGKYDIPKDTTVVINHYALHFDPVQWPQPNKFNPDRFLDAKGKMAPKPDSWLPFSAGRRVCLGESVAKPELHLLLAGIMRHFKVSLPPGTEVDFTPRGGSFANIPNDYNIVAEPRY